MKLEAESNRHKCSLAIYFLIFGAVLTSPRHFSAASGPILEEENADRIVDSFDESPARYKKRTRGKLEYKLTPRPGYSKDGPRSLLVELQPTGNKGRNSLLMDWRFSEPQDWSGYEGLLLWYQAQDEESPGFTVCAFEPSGAHYWQKIMPKPRQAGAWQPIKLPSKNWSWSWEGPEDKDKKLDLAHITGLRIEIRGQESKPVVFALDGLGLTKARPPYTGPTLNLRTDNWRYRKEPGQDFNFLVEVRKLSNGRSAKVQITATDYWGRKALEKTLSFTGAKNGDKPLRQKFILKNEAPGYTDLSAILEMDGKRLYRVDRAVGSIPKMEPRDAGPNPDSIFGIWVGGGQWTIGAKWTRSYLRGTDVQLVDGKYQFRKNPPGVYAPVKRPELSYTFYFSAMPKWLSSKPDRADFKKWSPKNWDDYAKFLEFVIRGASKGGFTHYEVWNEPVPYAYWMGPLESVVKLHEVTYKAIKKVQPDAVVLGPCPYTFLWGFLEKYFELGGAKWIDDVVVHAYGGKPDIDFAQNIRKLRKLMKKYGLGDRDIYITEKGYRTPYVTEHEQAQYLVRCYVYALSERVRLLTWHMLWDYRGGGDPGHAILRHDHTPRPSYVAYTTLTRVLERAKYIREVPGLLPSQRGYVFEKRGRRIRVLWDTEAEPTVALIHDLSATATIIDIVGGESMIAREVDAPFRIQLTANPIYLITSLPAAGKE